MIRTFLEIGAALVAAALLWGCGTLSDMGERVGIGDPEFCLRIEASPRANFFYDQPHVVRLLIHPLSDPLGFQEASESWLLSGKPPKGATGDLLELHILPGEVRSLTRPLPPETTSLGIVADYYRPEGAQAGPRALTAQASCKDGGPLLVLDESEPRLP